jgi:hypothetical protein
MINSLFSCALLDVTVQLLIFHKTLENISSSDVFFFAENMPVISHPKKSQLGKIVDCFKEM